MSEDGSGMHLMLILDFGGFPAENAEVCRFLRHLEMLSFLVASQLLLKVPAVSKKTSPYTSPSLTFDWLERFRHMQNEAVALHAQ